MQKLRTLSQFVILVLLARLIFGLGDSDFEKWCPFGGVETLYLFFFHDTFSCSLGSSNLYMLLGVLALTLVTRRSFCSWVCPVGTLGEWAGWVRERTMPGHRLAPREGVDLWLRKLKYPLLVVILACTYYEKELIFRAFDPCYALCSKHGEDITNWAYVSLAAVVVGGFFLRQPFCRYLCPLGAVLNLFSRFGLMRVVRVANSCVDCGRCDQVCDQGIAVSKSTEVKHARCTQCQACLSACPKKEALYLGVPGGDEKEVGS